jgi:ATP-dependent Lhr-like helicase
LQPCAETRLIEIRKEIEQAEVLRKGIFEIAPNIYGILPWLGTKAFNALDFILSKKIKDRQLMPNYFPIMFVKNTSLDNLIEALHEVKTCELTIDDLDLPKDITPIGKYGDFVPPNLIQKQFVDRFIDIDEMQRELESFKYETSLYRGFV